MKLKTHHSFFLIEIMFLIISSGCYYLYYLYGNIGAIVVSLICLSFGLFIPNKNIVVENTILNVKTKIIFNLVEITKKSIVIKDVNHISFELSGGRSILLYSFFDIKIIGETKYLNIKGFYYEEELQKLVETIKPN
ncbi:MAG: hypothetical protein AB7O47_09225 [Flavobacteriales bacterium]